MGDYLNKKSKILIVDDVPENIQVIANILSKMNCEIFFAQNGKEALMQINNNIFDLILLDIMMPDISGFEVCEKIKQEPKYDGIPVMFLTAKTDSDSIMKGFELGAVDYITKPFNANEVIARVKTHLELKMIRENLVNKTCILEKMNISLLEAKEELSKSKAKLKALMDSIPDLIFYKDVNSVYMGCNKAFEEYAQKKEEEIIGLTDLDIFPKDVAESYMNKDLEIIKTNSIKRYEEWIEFPDKQKRLVETLKTPFYYSNGEMIGIIGISRDITERKKLEEDLANKNNENERLLLNILPQEIAEELREKDSVEPKYYNEVTVVFTDFKDFTVITEKLSPIELVNELDYYFNQFDYITREYDLEKLKTIGDSFMYAGGIPITNKTHPIDCTLAALEFINFMNKVNKEKIEKDKKPWELRIGIHTGPVIAGVVGNRKFTYDIWGDTVNTASRMESSGLPGKINVSYATYEKIKDFFVCEYRGKIQAKNKGEISMYFVNGIKPELSQNGEGKSPNETFFELYEKVKIS